MSANFIEILGRKIGPGHPVFIIAEMSANHNQDFDAAVEIIRAAKRAGADAIKIQTYTADTITLDSANDCFKVKDGPWGGETLYSLYEKAYTPWEWQPKLKKIADEEGIILFSTPFDNSSVDFLEEMEVPAYKVASFELVDIPLIEYIASKGKPIIMSTGMATAEEIEEATSAARNAGAKDIALLKCTSAYPALPEEMNLKTIPDLADTFQVVSGLSDHTLGTVVAVTSVALGASIIEKHFTLSRENVGPDSFFSIEPEELAVLVDAVRTAEKALGEVRYGAGAEEGKNRIYRRSLFIVEDIKEGEVFTEKNLRSIRPGNGLPPKHINEVLGRKATREIKRGTSLKWDLVSK